MALVTADGIIRAGFWVQVMLLVLVDVATAIAFAQQPVAWVHWVGCSLVNAAAIPAAFVVWRWLRLQRSGVLEARGAPETGAP